MRDVFDRYLLELRKTPLGEQTEHTGRAALEALLNAFAARAAKDILVQHEPKRVADKGAPDFKISRRGMIVGYVENKGIGTNLDQVLKGEQIAKYRSLSGNILLTDYLHWIWIRSGSVQRETLCFATDLENPKFRVQEAKAAAVALLIEGFFSTAPEGIGRAQQLALALATRSQLLRDYLGEELVRQEREHREGRLYGLFQVFRDYVFHELTLKEFADAFAQMLAYGLLLARLNAEREIDLHNAKQFIPGSFRLIRELAEFLDVLENERYKDVRWVVEEILSITNGLDLIAIHDDLSFRHRKVRRGVRARSEEEARLFERDPFVYFYEDYLHRYDPHLRETRGVYYTPPPVVNFIIRAIDAILKKTFAIKEGLADHNRVTVLDFACGTGTFLVEVFERIFENIDGPDSGKASLIVRHHILKNVYGFEYLIAPYTIAHLKLSQFLADRGHALQGNERLPVFLTNTLELIEPQKNWLLPELSQEIQLAQEVKEKPILVITGNPPYSGHSRNMGSVARASVEKYRFLDGKPLGEKNPKWLQDDYVKFIRFAQLKMDTIDAGIVGIITNHSYLSNPTFRGMRQSLMSTFDQIYILDLHGSTKPKETPPAGIVDENVFEIQKGVAISLLIRRAGVPRGVWYAELWGRQLDKYRATATLQVHEMEWAEVKPASPFYLFIPHDRARWAIYEQGCPIRQIFQVNALGFQTHRDHFAIAFTRDEVEVRIADLSDEHLKDQDLREEYALKDNRDWQLTKARKALIERDDKGKGIIECAYRPFDDRWCFFGYEVMDYPRSELLDHVAWRDNLQLLVSRQVGTGEWRHVLVATNPAESCVVSNQTKAQNYNFPLYLYPPTVNYEDDNSHLFNRDDPFADKERIENLAPEFREEINTRYGQHVSPENIMGFIYAILHAPTYRNHYVEFLRIDFPRIPFPENRAEFEELSVLGWDLVQKHLLRDVPALGLGRYRGRGNNMVDKPRYVEVERAVYINATQHFAPVLPEVWDFHIGGYQVLAKYLKDRRGRTLTLDEIANIENVANVLAYTITAMQRIDDVYNKAFGRVAAGDARN